MTILPLKKKNNCINEDLQDTIVFGENHKMQKNKKKTVRWQPNGSRPNDMAPFQHIETI